MDSRPHAVVTGGAGFVGSHLVDRLLADGYRVTTLDNYGSGRHENLAHVPAGAPLRELDHDVREPLPALEGVEEFYHLASRASPADFQQHAVEIAGTNSTGTRNVFDAALDHDATVVLASTSEVYGDPEVHPQSESYRGNVDPRGPRAPYDESKRFAESLATAYRGEHGLDVRTVRIFNTYGPRMRADDGRVVPTFVSQALRGRALTVHGTGEQTRSFCYVTDLVEGIRRVAAASTDQAAGEVFNLGSDREITVLSLARAVLEAVDTDATIERVSRPADDPDVRCPDVSRAASVLGWSPEVELETGLERTVDAFRESLRNG